MFNSVHTYSLKAQQSRAQGFESPHPVNYNVKYKQQKVSFVSQTSCPEFEKISWQKEEANNWQRLIFGSTVRVFCLLTCGRQECGSWGCVGCGRSQPAQAPSPTPAGELPPATPTLLCSQESWREKKEKILFWLQMSILKGQRHEIFYL